MDWFLFAGDPFEYVRRQLMKMTKYTFFEEHDLEILYDVLDTEKTGCLTKEKCAIGKLILLISHSYTYEFCFEIINIHTV